MPLRAAQDNNRQKNLVMLWCAGSGGVKSQFWDLFEVLKHRLSHERSHKNDIFYILCSTPLLIDLSVLAKFVPYWREKSSLNFCFVKTDEA